MDIGIKGNALVSLLILVLCATWVYLLPIPSSRVQNADAKFLEVLMNATLHRTPQGFIMEPTLTHSPQIEVLITDISEQSLSSTVQSVSLMDATSYNSTQIGNTTIIHTYHFPNYATLTINITFFPDATNFTFAGREVSLSPQTVKMTLRISSWPFRSTQNTLTVAISTIFLNSTSSAQVLPYGGDWELDAVTINSGSEE